MSGYFGFPSKLTCDKHDEKAFQHNEHMGPHWVFSRFILGLDMFGGVAQLWRKHTGVGCTKKFLKQLVQSFLDEVLRCILVHCVYILHTAVFPIYLGKCIESTTGTNILSTPQTTTSVVSQRFSFVIISKLSLATELLHILYRYNR